MVFFLDFDSIHEDNLNKKLTQVDYKNQMNMVRNRFCCHGVRDSNGHHLMKSPRDIKSNFYHHL